MLVLRGISVAYDRLYIADTNNHVIRIADLKAKAVSTFQFGDTEKGLERPGHKASAVRATEMEVQKVKWGEVSLAVDLNLPEGYKLNSLAPSRVVVSVDDQGAIRLKGGKRNLTFDSPGFPLKTLLETKEGEGKVKIDMTLYTCQTEKESLCYFKEISRIVPLRIGRGKGKEETKIELREKNR